MAFTVSGGQIISPNGQPFVAKGVNAYFQVMNTVVTDFSTGAPLTNTFPGVNFLRLNIFNGDLNGGAAALQPYVSALTKLGIVVEIEYHEYPSVLTGSTLSDVANWYSSLASAFKDNPNVWFGTQNEPNADAGSVDNEISTIYNAIRSTGNNTIVMMNPAGGFSTNGFDPSVFSGMTNVAWDLHYYNWVSNYSSDLATNQAALANEIAGAQTITDANGKIPVIIGEYGDSTDGTNVDPGWQATVNAVDGSGYGTAAWAWNGWGQADFLLGPPFTGGQSELTAYGQMVEQHIATAAPSGSGSGGGTGGGSTAPDPTIGTGADSLVLKISEDAYANGDGTSDAAGDATFTVAIDGKQQGGTFTAAASHAAGADQTFTFNGYFGTGNHTVTVNFLNDAWGGAGSSGDRNLYIDGVTYKGTNTNQSAALYSNGSQNFAISGGSSAAKPSPDGTEITSASASPIIDAKGNAWSLVQSASNGLQIAVNGTVDPVTANVVLLETLGGKMVQENTSGNWYSEPGAAGPWSQITAPLPVPVAGAPVTTGSGSDTLVLSISEDAYANKDGTSDAGGDAAFTVSVDGKQLAGTFYATAQHATGASQNFTFKGDWAPGAHTVAVQFLNDAWGGTASTDRNLYVNDVTYDGTDTKQSATLYATGSHSFGVTDSTPLPQAVIGAGSDSLVLKVSEDAYLGNAQFTVAVDGKQLGGTFTATTLHSSGNSQTLAFASDFGAGQHTVAVNFLNDAWGGTASTDRNLYVNDIVYNGTDTRQSATLYTTGAKTFSVSGGTTPSVSETGDHGSLQKNLSQAGSYSVGGDTFVLSSGNAAAVTLGTGVSQIKFVGPGSATVTGGAGQATITADTGNNKFVAGAGSLDVTGGAGKDAYVFHASSGLLTLEDFSLAKGDTLTIDKSLQGSLHQTSDGRGDTMLTFGTDTSHGVDLHGVASVSSSNVLWA